MNQFQIERRYRSPRTSSVVSLRTVDYLLVVFAVGYLVLSCSEAWGNPRTSLVAVTTLAVNGALAIVGLEIAIVRSYLLFCVFFLFNLLFLSFAALQQIASDFDPIFHNLALLELSSVLCLFMTIAGLAAVAYRPYRPSIRKYSSEFLGRSLAGKSRVNYLLLVATSVSVSIGLIAFYGSGLFVTTREAFYQFGSDDKSTQIIIDAFLRPFTVIAPIIGATVAYSRKNHGWTIAFLIILTVGALINNPIISARFRSSALIVFCVLVLFGWHRVRLFLCVYISGLLASPIFGSIFRYKDSQLDLRTFSQFFANVDFSGLDIFCYTIMWADQKGFEYGSNILGGLLFFVPRGLWPEKGKTVGEIISDYIFFLKDFGTDNVSSPPPVEGYLSFGAIGAIVMSTGVVLLIDWVERRGMEAETKSPMYFILCLSPMLCMILLRGPFQVGFAEWTMHSAAALAAAAILCAVPGRSKKARFRRPDVFHLRNRERAVP